MKAKFIIDEINQHIRRINSILPEIESWIPLNQEDFNNTEKVKTIDSFIYRFIKMQDKMGEKLFPNILIILEEYKSNMPFIDVLNRLERLEILPSADEWLEFRNLRNALTHEYPGNEEEMIESITAAIEEYHKMLAIFNEMVEILSERDSR